LSSFKFSTKVWERAMLVNTPILEVYASVTFAKVTFVLDYTSEFPISFYRFPKNTIDYFSLYASKGIILFYLF
ncbi:hypothetical protein PL430_13325, partial [Phocaeicola vulgatus]|nr:hypothetical protein [Phocaeicola vulgatus]